MKKLLVSALAVVTLAACAPKETASAAKNHIDVVKESFTVTQGAQKSSFKQDVCDSIAIYNAAGESVACDVIYYTKPVSTQTVGEFEVEVAYKEGESVATATLKMIVEPKE